MFYSFDDITVQYSTARHGMVRYSTVLPVLTYNFKMAMFPQVTFIELFGSECRKY